jgi:hypothetical protein
MVLGYFEEEKVYDFIIVGGKYKLGLNAVASAEHIQVEQQETASQAVWQKIQTSRSSSSRLARSLFYPSIFFPSHKDSKIKQQPSQRRKDLDSRSCVPTGRK